MYKHKTLTAFAAVALLALSVLGAPSAVATSETEDYVGPVVLNTDNHCESADALLTTLPCFDVAGSSVEVDIADDSTLDVNGVIQFLDGSGGLISDVSFCGNSGSEDVPSGAKEIRISRSVAPGPAGGNDCTEVNWTTGTITVNWD